MNAIRVLIVDDSATIRRILTEILSRDPEIEVIGSAPEPHAARKMIRELNPDVITLDVEMPNMNGIEFLEKIMRLRPMPVVMVSTMTQRGAETTLAALELGAVDYYAKPVENVVALLDAGAAELCQKVKTAARARVQPRSGKVQQSAAADDPSFDPHDRIVAIGSSTGGVEALLEVLSHFPQRCPPTVITQHMPAHFTTSFAQRLNKLCKPEVTEAEDGAPLNIGHIYIARGGETHLEVTGRTALRCTLTHGEQTSGHRPSVDVLFASAARSAGSRAIGVLLTGMGRDGAQGLKAMRDVGAATIGQDESSCVVYGMPRAAFEIGAVERQLPLGRIGPEILRICSSGIEGEFRHAVRR